jgi:hypothetical protein
MKWYTIGIGVILLLANARLVSSLNCNRSIRLGQYQSIQLSTSSFQRSSVGSNKIKSLARFCIDNNENIEKLPGKSTWIFSYANLYPYSDKDLIGQLFILTNIGYLYAGLVLNSSDSLATQAYSIALEFAGLVLFNCRI